ncbi:MAG: hypothetical protein BGO31_20775 [Bacteroidetes bacterium 43-16]|uniref:hypothetical protein n=1 Tax=uncultured Dysgonomonas sp. TaxID=206096 RepID=UPI00092BF68D|nr:hypothetical protein [uncultured Dysgonomonas sp.]OJV55366.1 MAG: hypothetical protein BGO31_20775 [Bacteroidetes bacterium 43-16]
MYNNDNPKEQIKLPNTENRTKLLNERIEILEQQREVKRQKIRKLNIRITTLLIIGTLYTITWFTS